MSQIFLSDGIIDLVLQEESSATVMAGWMNNREVTMFLGRGHWPMTMNAEIEYLKNRYANHQELTFGVVVKSEAKLIGSTGLHKIDPLNQNAEFGIMIGEKDYWGKGYGSRALTLMLRHGFETLNLRHIKLRVLGNNPRGKRCYEKCGFREVGRLPDFIFKNGSWHDEIIMLKSQD